MPVGGGGNHAYLSRTVTPSGAGFVVGCAVTISASFGAGAGPFVGILEGASIQVGVRCNADMTLSLLRGSTVVATSTAVLTVGTVAYVEFSGTIDPSSGSLALQVNGSTSGWPTFSGNTRNTASSTWTGIGIGNNVLLAGNGPAVNYDFDDLYVCDQSGSAPWISFLGDCRVDALLPSGAGATSGWTPSAGSNYACVDETAPNDDTDYVSATSSPLTDTYTYPDAPVAGAAIYGVQVGLAAKKTDAGTCTLAAVVRHGGTDYAGGTLTPTTAYAYHLTLHATNPGTSAQWTEAGFNAAEFGPGRTG
jgi:hypothetical protein